MKYNTQTDSKWSNDSMALPEDLLGNLGCYASALANAIQDNSGCECTPKYLNDLLKNHDGYRYPKDTQDKNHASELNWSVIQDLFNLTKDDCNIQDYVEKNKTYYIAEIHGYSLKYPKHFMNVIKKTGNLFLLFDVYAKECVYYKASDIFIFKRITFK